MRCTGRYLGKITDLCPDISKLEWSVHDMSGYFSTGVVSGRVVSHTINIINWLSDILLIWVIMGVKNK